MQKSPPPTLIEQNTMPAPHGLHDLIQQCEHMNRAYETAGAPLPRKRPDGFRSLLRTIVDQQVSVQAGTAIWRKLEGRLGVISPQTIANAQDETLRAGGLSRAKAKYAKALSDAILSGRLALDELRTLPDGAVMEKLTEVKGIGRWTAEIYLMFALDRPDIFPVGDLALIVSTSRLMKLEARPDQREMERIAEAWRPWRSTAALMLWHYYRFTGGAGAPGEERWAGSSSTPRPAGG